MEQYILLPKKLGKGSFGTVALVQRKPDNQLFAMKMINIDPDELTKSPYDNEITILKKLQHPNIIKFYETFTDKEQLCLIMEYCDNGDLQKKIQEAREESHHFSEEQIIEWFCQLCLAVKYLHDHHIIHRDIKIHNIFLSSTGLVKVGDFGISKQLDNTTDLSQTQTGTPLYLTPEMLLSSTSSYKSDIWMLGCLLHQLCSLEKPFKGESLPIVVNQILKEKHSPIPNHYSPFLHNLIDSLLEKDLDKRPTINNIISIPEIQRQVIALTIKYPDVYNKSVISGLNIDKKYEGIEKSKPPSSILTNLSERSKSFSVSATLPFPSDTLLDAAINTPSQSNLRQEDQLRKQLSDSQIAEKNFPSPPARRSNNIWSLVQQKKTHHPLDRSGNISSSSKTPDQEGLSPADGSPLFDCVKEWKDPQSIENLPENIGLRKVNSDREGDSLKKGVKLSIQIPDNSPEQSQIRKLTSESTKEGQGKPDTLKIAMRQYTSDPNVVSTAKTVKKEFTFSHLVFENKSPISPTRSLWVPQFLKGKLGNEKYNKVVDFLEHVDNPLGVLKEQSELVLEIIGKENEECLVMLSFLMTCSSNTSTPTADSKLEWNVIGMDKVHEKESDSSKQLWIKTPKKLNPQKSVFSKGSILPINFGRKQSGPEPRK